MKLRTKYLRRVKLPPLLDPKSVNVSLDPEEPHLYDLIGTFIIRFMMTKRNPFPQGTLSRVKFDQVPVWKRAYIFLRGIRTILKTHANSHWNNYGYVNYKFNERVFEAYCKSDALIWGHCKLYRDMPKEVITSSSASTPPKKRVRSSFELKTPEDVKNSPAKVICLVTDSDEESE